MKIDISPNGEVFAKQVAQVRRFLDSQHTQSGQGSVSARMMKPTFLPYLTVLRSELRDDVVPQAVLDGAADLIANLAKTTVETMYDAPGPVLGQGVEQLLMRACEIACQAIVAEDAGKRPHLTIVPKQIEGETVIHNTKGDSK